MSYLVLLTFFFFLFCHFPFFRFYPKGNADGLGATRTKEILRALDSIGLDQSRVRIIDDERLQDGMDEVWAKEVVASFLVEAFEEDPFQLVCLSLSLPLSHMQNVQ